MQKGLNDLTGFAVTTGEAGIGHVKEFYFDDAQWVVRYLVVDVGTWLAGRRVLIAPAALLTPAWGRRQFPVDLTREQIETSPDIDTDKPIARQHEIDLHRHYGWQMYLAAETFIGDSGADILPLGEAVEANKGGKPFDPHLRTTRVMTGLHIEATDGRIGHVADFLADTDSWAIERLVVDTRDWLPGRTVLIPPQWVCGIDIDKRVLSVNASRQQIQDSPAVDARCA